VLDEEAAHAGELVRLLGQHDDVEIDVRQIGARELEAARVVRVVDVDRRARRVRDPLLERLDRLAVVVFRGAS